MVDPYVHILKDVPQFIPFVYPGLQVLYNEKGERIEKSYWESKFKVSDLHQMRGLMGAHRFAALIQQNPTQSEDATFKEEWLQWFTWGPADHQGRPTIIRQHDKAVISLDHTNVFMVFDPALGTDRSEARNAIIVFAMDADENIYILDAWATKSTLEIATRGFIQRLVQWEPDCSGCEDVLFQSLILPAIKNNLRSRALSHYQIRGVQPKGRSKDFRILSLQPIFEQRRVYMHRSQDELITEYLTHPNGKYRDLLDALAYGPDLWYVPRRASLGKDPLAAALAKRDPVTGY